MKLIFKIIFYIFLFIYLILAFLPKHEIYNFALSKLQTYEVQIDSTSEKDKYFGFTIENANILFKDIKAANIENIDLSVLLYKNKINIQNISIAREFSKILPASINILNISHSILNPLFVNIELQGEEYKGHGTFDIVNNSIKFYFYPSNKFTKKYATLLKQLKKISDKEYIYEYSL